MRTRFMIVFVTALGTLTLGAQTERTGITLSSLKSGCKVERQVEGQFSRMWLACKDVRFLVTHQLNFFGHVLIETPDQALEFVRLFTSKESYISFDTFVYLVEILSAEDDGIFALNKDEFEQFCPQVDVEGWGGSVTEPEQFSVVRCAVDVQDRGLYRIQEAVTRNGHYALLSKELLFEKAEDLGIFIPGKF